MCQPSLTEVGSVRSGRGSCSERQQQLEEQLIIIDLDPAAIFRVHDVFKLHENITCHLHDGTQRQGLAILGTRQAWILDGRPS